MCIKKLIKSVNMMVFRAWYFQMYCGYKFMLNVNVFIYIDSKTTKPPLNYAWFMH